MSHIEYVLDRLGLQQYCASFVAEGFDTWETLLDIQESDLDVLGVKLGHRRKLQRAIADYRGIPLDRLLNSPGHEGHHPVIPGVATIPQQTLQDRDGATNIKEQKRRYRRHPKADENAPEKPASAYVLFSNKIREDVKSQNLSFTEIARLVGEKWQRLDSDEKSIYETRASDNKDEYNRLLGEYKKTPGYDRYMDYLADFRAKHGGRGDGMVLNDSKRAKLDNDGDSSQGNEDGQPDDAADTFHAHLDHARAGSVSSASTTSKPGRNSQMTLQIVAPKDRVSAEIQHQSPRTTSNSQDYRYPDRTSVQRYPRRHTKDIDEYSSGFSRTSPSLTHGGSTGSTAPSQDSAGQTLTEGDYSTSSKLGHDQHETTSYTPMRRQDRHSDTKSELFDSPVDGAYRHEMWDNPKSEDSRRTTYDTNPTPTQQSPTQRQFLPIAQLVGSNRDYGPRRLPPIHLLNTTPSTPSSTSPSAYNAAGPSSLADAQPNRSIHTPIGGRDTMAFRTNSQQWPSVNVNVNANIGESGIDREVSRSPEAQRQQQLHTNQYARSLNNTGGTPNRRR